MLLTEEEQALAKYYDFDELVLEKVKTQTGSPFDVVVLEQVRMTSAPHESYYHKDEPEFKAKYKQYLLDMKKQFPELSQEIDVEMGYLEMPKNDFITSFELGKRREKISFKYRPKLVQNLNRVKKTPGGHKEIADLEARWIEIEDDKEFEIAIQEYLDQIDFDETCKPEVGFRFSVPVDPQILAQMKAMGDNLVTDKPPGDPNAFEPTEERKNDDMPIHVMPLLQLDNSKNALATLNELVEPLGYCVVSADTVKIEGYYFTYADALRFAHEHSDANSHFEITCWDNIISEVFFDPETPNELNSQSFHSNLQPFTRLEKLDKNLWKVIPCKAYNVEIIKLQAVLQKRQTKAKKSDKFELLAKHETNGINYGVDTERILEKLHEWDKLYGVTLHNAKFDSFTISFKKLPKDLSYLCTEMWLFCPEMVELNSTDYEQKASRMRDFACKLKESKEVSFWWD